MHSQRFQRGYVPIFLSYYKPHMKLFILDMCCALGEPMGTPTISGPE